MDCMTGQKFHAYCWCSANGTRLLEPCIVQGDYRLVEDLRGDVDR